MSKLKLFVGLTLFAGFLALTAIAKPPSQPIPRDGDPIPTCGPPVCTQ